MTGGKQDNANAPCNVCSGVIKVRDLPRRPAISDFKFQPNKRQMSGGRSPSKTRELDVLHYTPGARFQAWLESEALCGVAASISTIKPL